MAHLLGLSPTEFALATILFLIFWIVGMIVLLPLQYFIAPAPIKPKPRGTTRQKLHFWLIILLGGCYLLLIPFTRMSPDPVLSSEPQWRP